MGLKSLSIKNKILTILCTVPIAAIVLIVVMATRLFKDDKLAYLYDTALSETQSKSSAMDSQMNGYIHALKAISFNFDPQRKTLSLNGKSYFNSEPSLKAFMNYSWNGKSFKQNFSLSKGMKLTHQDKAILGQLMGEAYHEGLSLGVSKDHPMHLYLVAKSSGKKGTNLTALLIENGNFFALFGQGTASQTFLFHPVRGLMVGNPQFGGISRYVQQNVFGQKIQEGVREVNFKDVPYLLSYSKVEKGKLYVVSLADKDKALAAVQTLMRRSVIFTSFIFFALIVIGVIAAHRLTVALRGLVEATSQVMVGDFTVRVRPKNDDEIGLLAKSFNKMTEEVSNLMDKTAENARMETELETAQTVQNALFPAKEVKIGPLHIYGDSVSASECGGDWWYYSRVGNKVYLWIGDATGHGVPAALLTSAARAVASVIESIPEITPAKALSMLNKAIYSTSKGEMMMTFFLSCFDLDKKTLTYCNASHDPPYYLSHEVTGQPKKKDYIPLMEVNNPRLGQAPDSEYSEHEMKVHEGDKIVFYTDGIMDVESPEGDLFGERRFLKSLAEINLHKVGTTVMNIFDQLNIFRKDTPLNDDVTLVVLEFQKEGGEEPETEQQEAA